MSTISGTSGGPGVPGVRGDGQTDNDGVQGFATHPDHVGVLGVGGGAGVKGDCPNGDGVQGFTNSPIRAGVIGINQTSGVGVKGVSEGHDAIQGFAKHPDHVGVLGVGGGAGVKGDCPNGDGVQGFTQDGNRSGVVGTNTGTGAGVLGQCENGVGVHAISTNGTGLVASGAKAGFFDGDVSVTGHINCNGNLALLGDCQLIGADVAEQFRVTGDRPAEPGSVMVLAGIDSIAVSNTPYDHRVAGIVSGAGNYRPGIVLDRQSTEGRSPLALSGKVWCLVDADEEAIGLGDLLTTSATPGHAMRASDRARAFGAVIGKALGEFPTGRGIIPVFVALH
jgi:hypothetical protein